jgi:hypothetical protein
MTKKGVYLVVSWVFRFNADNVEILLTLIEYIKCELSVRVYTAIGRRVSNKIFPFESLIKQTNDGGSVKYSYSIQIK